jgi:hypothetical protein
MKTNIVIFKQMRVHFLGYLKQMTVLLSLMIKTANMSEPDSVIGYYTIWLEHIEPFLTIKRTMFLWKGLIEITPES